MARRTRGRRTPGGNDEHENASREQGRMRAPKSGVRVRMYRHGHGDCFLLAFPGARGRPVYVLIDCGYKPGSNHKYGLSEIDDIVENIAQATGGTLDLVIVTHEHQDHVNGFWREKNPPFEDFEMRAAWFAWTEDPNDDLANELRRRHHDQLLGLIAARNQLAADDRPVARLDDLLTLELGIDAPAELALAAAKKKKEPNDSVNKQGMRLVKKKAGKKNTKYIRAHHEIMRVPGVEGVRVFAFGPPYDEKLLADEDPEGTEAFPGLAVRASFFAAARAAEDPDEAYAIRPFSRRFTLPLEEAFTDPQHGPFFSGHYGRPEAAAQPDSGSECAPDAAWRRIDKDWLYSAEDLALALNKGINNTSLVLAFELERSKKVLLFIGDAQRGNWISWTQGSWTDGDDTITVRDLMARTVLYKVGHHGSHNATLKGTADCPYPNLGWMGHGKYANEFTAMITAVRKWAYEVPDPPWRHPLPSIKKALRDKCAGRVLQIDMKKLEPPDDPDDDWQDFVARTRLDPDRLYFEHDVHDG
jgi:hypothetical protein